MQIEEDGSQRRSPLEVVLDGPPGGGRDEKRAEDVCRGEERRSHARVDGILAHRLRKDVIMLRLSSCAHGPAT